jgi:DNA-binding NarL/FixJ family response regulator
MLQQIQIEQMPPDPSHLSQREREVLSGLLRGKSEMQIAEDLFLAKGTVHKYVMLLYREFGVTTRAELMSLWIATKSVRFAWEPKTLQKRNEE